MVNGIGTGSQLSVLHALQATTKQESKALQKLATGKKVNQGSDDVTALVKINRLSSAIGGLARGSENASVARGVVDTASGGLTLTLDNLQRMREVAVRAADGGMSAAERQALSAQIDDLKQGMGAIAQSVTQDGTNLLDGSFQAQSFQVGSGPGDTIAVSIDSATTSALGVDTASVSSEANASAAITAIDTAITSVVSSMSSLGSLSNRLERVQVGNQQTVENLANARSTIEDTDIAQAVGELKRLSITKEAALRTLSQLNATAKQVRIDKLV